MFETSNAEIEDVNSALDLIPRTAKVEQSGDGDWGRASDYIPQTRASVAPTLAYHCDYFALARLLADYRSNCLGSPRMPWDCHILSSASMAAAFYDLDEKLFGIDSAIHNILMLKPHDFANALVDGKHIKSLSYGGFEDVACIMPGEAQGLINRFLNNAITKTSERLAGQDDKKQYIEKAWGFLKNQTKGKEQKLYKPTNFHVVLKNAGNIIYVLNTIDPEFKPFGWFYSIGESIMVHRKAIINSIRESVLQRGMMKIASLPAGETIFWHVGLGPRPVSPSYEGCRFGFLTVEGRTTNLTRATGKRLVARQAVKVKCDCGKNLKAAVDDLLRGRILSCGGCGRPKTLTASTLKNWALKTLDNAKTNREARRLRHNYLFKTPEELLYFAGVRAPGFDLSRIDDHDRQQTVVYAPGNVFWEDPAVNRAVKTKALRTTSELKQQVMLEKIPDDDSDSAFIDFDLGYPANDEMDDSL